MYTYINGLMHTWPTRHIRKTRVRCVLLLMQTSAVSWFWQNFEMLNFLYARGRFSFDLSDKIYFCRKPNDLSDLKTNTSLLSYFVVDDVIVYFL